VTTTALSRQRAALLVIDLQERLVPAMPEAVAAQVLRNAALLIHAAARLGLPIVVSEQYPRGLGATVAPIAAALDAAAAGGAVVHRFEKLELSAAASPALAALLADPAPSAPLSRRDQWIVAGMEAHVCVYQTVRDLTARGYQVHVASDAVSSRAKANWRVGLALAARAGAVPSSTEVCVFDLLARAGTEEFRALVKLIK
jgi:nicotinamidase-related amidase